MRNPFLLCFVLLSLFIISASGNPQTPAQPPSSESVVSTPETLVEQIKTTESPTIQVETTEEGRVLVHIRVELPYSSNLLLQARNLALKYTQAFFTQTQFQVDALDLEFFNAYAAKILDVHIGRDRLFVKYRNKEKSLVEWEKMQNHVQFFLRLNEIQKKGETPFNTITYKAYLYPEEWPQNKMLYGSGQSSEEF